MDGGPEPVSDEGIEPLYRHVRREGWGLAILVADEGSRRSYQFEDGKLRQFKVGFYHLLQEVDQPANEAAPIVERLQRRANVSRDLRRQAKKRGAAGRSRPITLVEQSTFFRTLFPEGFDDPAWRTDVRGEGAPRRLKSHRGPALEDAQTALAQDVVDGAIAEGRCAEVVESLRKVLAATDLVGKASDLGVFDGLDEEAARAVVTALRELLWGETPNRRRFDGWLRVLGREGGGPSWQVATAPAALVHPDRFPCVRPSTWRPQARWLAPRATVGAKPTAEQWCRLTEMATALRETLADRHELAAQDLLDVHDFIWTTLRPMAKKQIEAARTKPAPSAKVL